MSLYVNYHLNNDIWHNSEKKSSKKIENLSFCLFNFKCILYCNKISLGPKKIFLDIFLL